MRQRVVVISADGELRARLARTFRAADFRVQERVGLDPLAGLVLDEPDLIVLDAGSALAVAIGDCRTLCLTLVAPVMILLGAASEQIELLCFNAGAVDVVHARTSAAVLVARARAATASHRMRAAERTRGTLAVGPLRLDLDARLLACDGRPVPLSRAEFAIIEILMSRPHHVIDRATMIRVGWGEECSERALESTVSRLRCKVREAGGPGIAVPMHGVGYRLGID